MKGSGNDFHCNNCMTFADGRVVCDNRGSDQQSPDNE